MKSGGSHANSCNQKVCYGCSFGFSRHASIISIYLMITRSLQHRHPVLMLHILGFYEFSTTRLDFRPRCFSVLMLLFLCPTRLFWTGVSRVVTPYSTLIIPSRPIQCTALHAASSSQFSRFKYLSRQESLDVEALHGSLIVRLFEGASHCFCPSSSRWGRKFIS